MPAPYEYKPQIEVSEDRARPCLLKAWEAIAALQSTADAYALGALYLPEGERKQWALALESHSRQLAAEFTDFIKVKG
jgi:hypothetical protein